jgi:penicillin-binding protein 1A
LPVPVVDGINTMLNSVAENGTGRRALIDGVKIAGKTGTTNAYRDAWFMGFSGNFVGGIWMGNDDYMPTRRMTGGSLPAMTWKQIMAYAHQGVELKPIPGVGGLSQTYVADNRGDDKSRPVSLSRRGTEVLVRVERMMEDASRALATKGAPKSADAGDDKRVEGLASASEPDRGRRIPR